MPQSRTLSVGMEVHKASIASASVAPAHGAEGVALGTTGTRQGDSDQLSRQRQSQRTPLVFVSAAGPCGSGLSRSLTQQGSTCGVVAPSFMPNKAGDRVHTDRRDAMPLARRMRAGDLPPVAVPAVAAEALRDLQAAPRRLTACFLRHAMR
jgi:transposase